MIDQLEIDRTTNKVTITWKETGMSEVQVDGIGTIILDTGNILILQELHQKDLTHMNYQMWLINEWHIHSNTLDVYYRPDCYDLQKTPPKSWLNAIDNYYTPLIDIFQDFRPREFLKTPNIFPPDDPRKAEIKNRANPEYHPY